MDKGFCAAVFGRDEAIALVGIEELDGAGNHIGIPCPIGHRVCVDSGASRLREARKGLVTPADTKRPGSLTLRAAPRAVESSALSDPAPADGPAIVSILPVAWHLLRARIELKARRLDAILCGIGRADPVRTRNPADLSRLARRFSRCRTLLPFPALCLPDSLAFLRFAAARGHYPQLVFGVEAYPFSAHCWVQHDGVVLNDLTDHAALFSPILVV